MDEQGWSYESAIPYMYKLVSAEKSWPSTNYDDLGLSRRQAEFRRVTRTVIEEFNANPRNHPPTSPNAIGQYLIEVQIWKILCKYRQFRSLVVTNESGPNERLKKFPSQRPVPPEPKALENLQESLRMAYEMAFTSPITEPTPLLATPQTPKPQSQTYQAVDIPSSSSSEKPIPTGPAAMRRHKVPAMSLQPRRPVHKQRHRRPDPYKKRHNQPTAPKPTPQTPHINHQPYKRVLPSNLRAEALKAILNSKGIGYVPKHGFNKFGLPLYTITCFAPDAFLAFTGKEQVYIKKIAEQLPKFRIMYQKTRRGFRKYLSIILSQIPTCLSIILTMPSRNLV